jgi:plastocyanin
MRKAFGLSILAALLVVGAAAGIFTARGDATPGATPKKKTVTTKVTVVATEYRFALSKQYVPVGTVLFKVVNKGQVTHNFLISGKLTKNLNPGQSQTLKVVFKKKGKFAYFCTILGHAKLGMKGTFGVGVKVAKPKPPVTTTTTTTTTTPTTTTSTATVGNTATTVQVGMFEYRYELSASSVPSGQVTFVITNKGQETHNFTINGVKSGKIISPGQTETYTVALPAGTYEYQCDVPFHADRGMVGSLTVTP